MIFTLHNGEELKGYEDTIRHLYAPLFQLLDLPQALPCPNWPTHIHLYVQVFI